MNNSQNIELKEQNDPKKTFQNSELFAISNKIKDLNQINNLHNETFNQINISTSNETDFKPNDKLFGNNYLNYRFFMYNFYNYSLTHPMNGAMITISYSSVPSAGPMEEKYERYG